uniref:Small ribosomal subunit protein uS15m n=2 Tax=Canis lupus familiaris TaxID=9615 RepID=A0A8C0NT26_CANLF
MQPRTPRTRAQPPAPRSRSSPSRPHAAALAPDPFSRPSAAPASPPRSIGRAWGSMAAPLGAGPGPRGASRHAEDGVEGPAVARGPGSGPGLSPRAAGRSAQASLPPLGPSLSSRWGVGRRGGRTRGIRRQMMGGGRGEEEGARAGALRTRGSALALLRRCHRPGRARICHPEGRVDDVVRRLLSLEMASQKEKLKIKHQQLMSKIVANPEDTSSLEARIVALTVKIRNFEEHMQKHRKDKVHKRYLLMSIDQRKKLLKNLRKTNYSVFEKTCKELGIEYTFPPLYHRKGHQRWVTKKALCIRVFQEAQKLKKQKRALKAKAAAQKQGQKNPESPSKAEPEAVKENQ